MIRLFATVVLLLLGPYCTVHAEPKNQSEAQLEQVLTIDLYQSRAALIAKEIASIRVAGIVPPIAMKWPKAERENFIAFYAQRNDAPIWYGSEALDGRRQILIEQITSADEDGLDVRDYPIPKFNIDLSDVRKMAEADIILSASAVAYARDARGARIDPVKLSKLITPKLNIPRANTILGNLIGAANPAQALASYQPSFEGYGLLKQKLADFKNTTASIGPAIGLSGGAGKKPLRTNTAMV
ncbi:MAG: hypothetical protein EB015_22600, partial [Methylocystaceae bacterium]|nr:hypothetical protein [Methylocystaceae bacterium]